MLYACEYLNVQFKSKPLLNLMTFSIFGILMADIKKKHVVFMSS